MIYLHVIYDMIICLWCNFCIGSSIWRSYAFLFW